MVRNGETKRRLTYKSEQSSRMSSRVVLCLLRASIDTGDKACFFNRVPPSYPCRSKKYESRASELDEASRENGINSYSQNGIEIALWADGRHGPAKPSTKFGKSNKVTIAMRRDGTAQ